MEVVGSFDEEYWKDAALEIGDIYVEMTKSVDDPTTECMNKMPSVFEDAEFVKTAQQSINAITDETTGLDYEWERYIGLSWLMKAEGTIAKLVKGEESATVFRIIASAAKLSESELKYGESFLVLIAASAVADGENQQKACESVHKWISETKAMDNLLIGVASKDWLESTKTP